MRMLQSETLYILIPNPENLLLSKKSQQQQSGGQLYSASWQPKERVIGKKTTFFAVNLPLKEL